MQFTCVEIEAIADLAVHQNTLNLVSQVLILYCICLTPRRHNLGLIEAVLLDRLSAAAQRYWV